MGFSREVKDFVAGFQSGWKMIEDAQSKDIYNRYLEGKMGDEDLSKYDPRLKATPKTGFGKILGGWFDSGEEEGETPVLEGADRGRAILEAKIKRAIELGLTDEVIKLTKSRKDFDTIARTGSVGFEPVKPPKAPDLSGAAPDPVLPVEPEFSRGGMVQRYALGGMAEEMPEDENPAKLFSAAQPAVAAGLRAIQSRLNVPAVDDGTPNPEVEKFAKGEGRMSEEEIRALDAKIDPDNELTPGQRSAARLSAIYQFYGDDPDTAADASARLLLREKWVSQARGGLALQALEQDDVKSAAKLVADAYNENLPDGNTIHVKVDPVDKGVVFQQLNEMQEKIFGGKVDKSQLVQLASNTADGSIFTSRLAQVAAMADKKRGAGTGAAVDPSAFNAAKANYLALSEAEDADPEAVQEAEAAMVMELQKLALKVSPRSISTGITALKNMGLKVPGADSKSSSGDTLKERQAAAEAAADTGDRSASDAAINAAADKMFGASYGQTSLARTAPEEVIPTTGPGMAYNGVGTPMIAPDVAMRPQSREEVLQGVSNNLAMEFGATPGSKALNVAARGLLQGAEEERGALEADINARKNKREVKFGDEEKLNEQINEIFDDLEKGPLAKYAISQGGGQKIVDPKVATQDDIDNLKQWTYNIRIHTDKLLPKTAAKVAMALGYIDPKNPMEQPFKVRYDKRGMGVVQLKGTEQRVNLDGDTVRQVLLWRRQKIEEFLRKQGAESGQPSIADKASAFGGAALNLGNEMYQGTRVGPAIVGGAIDAGKSTTRFIRDAITKMPSNPGNLPVLGNPMDEFVGSR